MLYTELKNRKLYFDGVSSYDPTTIVSLINKYTIKYVDYITPSISQYNKLESNPNNKILTKTTCNTLDYSWNIPEHYKNLDVVEYVLDKHIQLTTDSCDEEINQRDTRLILELHQYTELDKLDMLRTIIYIVHNLTDNNTVYGIGRGSSVSSYVLFVIGIHDVDSYLYDLDINDFLKG
jgi:DNA polymerase III alpha subunit